MITNRDDNVSSVLTIIISDRNRYSGVFVVEFIRVSKVKNKRIWEKMTKLII